VIELAADWPCRQVAALWEGDITFENDPLTAQANKLQAIHIVFACYGRISTARELLERARRCASVVGKAERIFCVKTYTWLPVDEFLATNAEMAAALNQNQLWDGMPLSEKS
jgi:hypothetical protein